MRPFSRQERAAIAEAITKAEAKTSGEIVVVVASASGGYFANALMWAALIALAVPFPFIHLTQWPIEYIYIVQLAVFAVGAVLVQWQALRFAIVPKAIKHARAHQRAVEQFLVQNMHTTKGRTGVLIYVSFAEHYAEIIADNGIYKKVPHKIWKQVVDQLTRDIGRGARTEGLIGAIQKCGEMLAAHFPPGKIHENELPNHLIVLDGYRGP